MQIRGAQPEDSPGIAKVQVDSYRSAYTGICSDAFLNALSYEEQEQDWRDWFEAYPEDVILVAEDDKERIIAYALGRPQSPIPGFDGELVALHVREKNQRMGIGRLLLWTMAREIKRRGATAMMLWIYEKSDAHGFYERMGGQKLDERKASGELPPEIAYGWLAIEDVARLKF